MLWTDRARLLKADYRETLEACGGEADLVFTSPPYCDARTYGNAVSWTDEDYRTLGDAAFAALKPGGHALINVDAPVREWRKGFGTERGLHPWRLLLDWTDRVGFRAPDRLAFGRLGLPGAYGGRFRNDFEPLLWFTKPGGEPFFDKVRLRVKVPAYRSAFSARERDGTLRTRDRVLRDTKDRGTLWDYGSVGKQQTGCEEIELANHPARWPFSLARDIVVCFCPEDGLACDPFVGAGTSLIAALDEGRRFVGGDLLARQDDGKPWIEVAAEIAEERYRQTTLFGGLR